MRILASLAFLAAFACSPATAPAATAPDAPPAIPVYGFEVVAEHPHDPAAFTEGLLIHEGQLWESTGEEGTSWVRKVDLATGQMQKQFTLDPKYFGEGMVIWDDRVISLTWRDQLGFILDKNTLEKKGEWTYPGEGWALTRDDKQIYMSDGTAQIRVWDPATLRETRRITVMDGARLVTQLNELEWVAGEIWANVWTTDTIVRISPQTGNVVGWIDLSALPRDRGTADVLNGIAYDAAGKRVIVTGKQWANAYQIELDPVKP